MISNDLLIKHYETNKIIASTINEERRFPNRKRVVAIFMYRNRIVTIGTNKEKTHPLIEKYGYQENFNWKRRHPLHAELDGYIKILKNNIEFDSVHVYRGVEANLLSRPCEACSNWLRRIRNIRVLFSDAFKNIILLNSEDL